MIQDAKSHEINTLIFEVSFITSCETEGLYTGRQFKYWYGIICLYANRISSVVGGIVWKSVAIDRTLPPTRLHIPLTCKQIVPYEGDPKIKGM
jgi:hypothetical protein